jgi:hypothetical protein
MICKRQWQWQRQVHKIIDLHKSFLLTNRFLGIGRISGMEFFESSDEDTRKIIIQVGSAMVSRGREVWNMKDASNLRIEMDNKLEKQKQSFQDELDTRKSKYESTIDSLKEQIKNLQEIQSKVGEDSKKLFQEELETQKQGYQSMIDSLTERIRNLQEIQSKAVEDSNERVRRDYESRLEESQKMILHLNQSFRESHETIHREYEDRLSRIRSGIETEYRERIHTLESTLEQTRSSTKNDFILMTQRYRDEVEKLTGINENSSRRGKAGEELALANLMDIFRNVRIEETAREANQGDYHMTFERESRIWKVMMEIKNHAKTNTIAKRDRDKALRNLDSGDCHAGILVAVLASIDGRPSGTIEFTVSHGKPLLYIELHGNFDLLELAIETLWSVWKRIQDTKKSETESESGSGSGGGEGWIRKESIELICEEPIKHTIKQLRAKSLELKIEADRLELVSKNLKELILGHPEIESISVVTKKPSSRRKKTTGEEPVEKPVEKSVENLRDSSVEVSRKRVVIRKKIQEPKPESSSIP